MLTPENQAVIGKGLEFYGPHGKPFWSPVFDLRDMTVIPVEWASPAELLRANGHSNFDDGVVPNLMCRKVGDETTMTKYAATMGFWNIPMSGARRLGKMELGAGASLGLSSPMVLRTRGMTRGCLGLVEQSCSWVPLGR